MNVSNGAIACLSYCRNISLAQIQYTHWHMALSEEKY